MQTLQSPSPSHHSYNEGIYTSSIKSMKRDRYHAANIADVMLGRGIDQIFYARVSTTDLVALDLRGNKPPKILFKAPDSFLRGSSIIDGKALESLEGVIIDEKFLWDAAETDSILEYSKLGRIGYLKRIADGFSSPEEVMQDPIWNVLSRADNDAYRNVLRSYANCAFSLKSDIRLMSINLDKPTERRWDTVMQSMIENDYLLLPLIFASLPYSTITIQNSQPEFSQEAPLIGIKE